MSLEALENALFIEQSHYKKCSKPVIVYIVYSFTRVISLICCQNKNEKSVMFHVPMALCQVSLGHS